MDKEQIIRIVLVILMLKTSYIYAVVRPAECLYKEKDVHGYKGTVSTTKTGKTCQRWDVNTPNSHRIVAQDLPEATLSEAKNYCRVADERFPWCYTTDPSTRWEYCRVPFCTEGLECKVTDAGSEYMGTRTTGIKNGVTYTCQRWDSQTPNSHGYNTGDMKRFFEKTVGEVANYCRNYKENDIEPWCYTADGPRFAFCPGIPKCPTTNLCSTQPLIANGRSVEPPISSKYDMNFKVTYTCDDGYEFQDKYDAIVCQLNGSWTTPPKCLPKKCPTLSVPNGKMVATDPDLRVGAKVTFTCDTGFYLQSGDVTRTCRESRTWSGTGPVCAAAKCDIAPELTDAKLTELTTVRLGGKATYLCSKDGKSYTLECKGEREWIGDTGACVGSTTTTTTTTTIAVLKESAHALQSDAFIAGLSIGLTAVVIAAAGIGVWIGRMRRIKFKERKVEVRPDSRGSSGYDSRTSLT